MNEIILERPLTRRELLAACLATGLLMLVGCGHDAGWTFVDDREQTVRLSKRPTRIVAYTAVAQALHQWGVTPVGVFGGTPREQPWLAGYPWSESELVGSVYGEIDVGKLRGLKSELIVSLWFPSPTGELPLFGFKDLAQQRSIASQVPVVGINGTTIAPEQIDRFGDLVRALGVDTTAATITQARSAFLDAAQRLSRIATRKSGLRILAVSADQSTMYVAKVAGSNDLAFYKRRGVPLLSADTSDPYWDRLSWDKAAKYTADGILYDARPIVLPFSQAKQIQAFAALPAVRANQIGRWQAEVPASYQAYTEAMDELAATIAGWGKIV